MYCCVHTKHLIISTEQCVVCFCLKPVQAHNKVKSPHNQWPQRSWILGKYTTVHVALYCICSFILRLYLIASHRNLVFAPWPQPELCKCNTREYAQVNFVFVSMASFNFTVGNVWTYSVSVDTAKIHRWTSGTFASRRWTKVAIKISPWWKVRCIHMLYVNWCCQNWFAGYP